MQRAHVNGIELEYEVTGTGDPVLMISPVLADGFRPLVANRMLAGRFQLITYHKRGWAGSTHTRPPVTIAEHARDAAALMDHLGVRCAHVVGHSSGAAVALQLAFDSPERVHTLALLELSWLSVPSASSFLEKAGPAFEAYAAGDREAALAGFMSLVSGMDWERCRAVLEEAVPGAVSQAIADAETFFGIELAALTAWTFTADQARGVSQPILSVLGSETETLWVDVARALRSAFGHVEECTIEGVGHLLHIQRAEPVAAALARFLDAHPLRSAVRDGTARVAC